MDWDDREKRVKDRPPKKEKYEPPKIECDVLPIAYTDEPAPPNPISALDPFFEICCPSGGG